MCWIKPKWPAFATSMKGVATRYPAIDAASGRLFNPEDRIGQCTSRHKQAGATLFSQRQGQMNLSCAQCHDQNFGQRLYTDLLSQGQPNAYPVYRLEWQKPGSLERRLRSCYAGIRAETPLWGALEMR